MTFKKGHKPHNGRKWLTKLRRKRMFLVVGRINRNAVFNAASRAGISIQTECVAAKDAKNVTYKIRVLK